MTKGVIKIGTVVGTGVAKNVELGFIPQMVHLYNATDGDIITTAFLSWIVPFTSGGTSTLAAGATIRGVTSLATANVSEVLVMSGTFAGGDAAGFAVLEEGSLNGTFQSENIVITNLATGVVGTDDATVTANVVTCMATTAGVATATGNSALSRYEGAAGSNSRGFTIGSTIAEANKALRYVAIRGDA